MKIHDMMVVKIHQYFTKHLQITDEEAETLHQEYYKSYGLALEGLVRHHKIGISPVCH
jgi:pyrimidine and pyridine-specific 5'-nucleotidase